MRLRPAVPAAAVLLGVLAGCGGSSAPAALSKADYVTRADALCATASTRLKGLTAPTSAAELGPYLTSSVEAAQAATDGLRRLKPPAADAAALEAKLTAPLAAQVASVKSVIPQYEAAAKAPDPKAALAAIPRPNVPRPDSAFVSAYGLKDCAVLASGGQGQQGPGASPQG